MNLIKKGLLLGTTACFGVTLYASLGSGAGRVSAINNNSLNYENLTQSAQNLSNLEMSLNNLLIATNRISFINDNIISVSPDYMQTLRGDSLTGQTGNFTTQVTNGLESRLNSATNENQNDFNTNQTSSSTGFYGVRANRGAFFSGRLTDEIARLNRNATDVRTMLSSVRYDMLSNINFGDTTKVLNMSAENLTSFSESTLNSTDEYPMSRRLALASIRISNQALEQLKGTINGTSRSTNALNNALPNNTANTITNSSTLARTSNTASSQTSSNANTTTNSASVNNDLPPMNGSSQSVNRTPVNYQR